MVIAVLCVQMIYVLLGKPIVLTFNLIVETLSINIDRDRISVLLMIHM